MDYSSVSGPSSSSGGVSFTFTKRSSSFRSNKEGTRDGKDAKDLVFSLEAGHIHSSKPTAEKKEYVIPLIRQTVWRVPGKEQAKDGEEKSEEKIEEELSLDREAAEAIVKDLQTSQSQSEAVEEGPVIPLLLQNKPPTVEGSEEDELADVQLRPESSSLDEYEDMPIGEFGKAMLKGMGWNPGQAIGKSNKGMVAPVEFIPRMGKLGLGAAPRPQKLPDKKRIKKPGETEVKPQGPYIGADGRVKHVRTIGEEIPEQPVEGFQPGNFARVLRGPHIGLCGKIVSSDEDSSRVSLKLAINKQVIDFSQHHLELVSREEYAKPPARPSDAKNYGLIKKKGESMDPLPSTSRAYESVQESESMVKNSSSSSKEISERKGKGKEKKRRVELSDSEVAGAKKRKRDESESVKPSGSSGSDRKRLWVAPNLRVRIIDTKFRGGRFYNSKVVVLDVVSGDMCVCQTADGKHLEGVRQSMLETVVPKSLNAAVMLVGGRHKGQIARVLERDSNKYKAAVEVVTTSEVVTVDYDDLCEYTGDVEDL